MLSGSPDSSRSSAQGSRIHVARSPLTPLVVDNSAARSGCTTVRSSFYTRQSSVNIPSSSQTRSPLLGDSTRMKTTGCRRDERKINLSSHRELDMQPMNDASYISLCGVPRLRAIDKEPKFPHRRNPLNPHIPYPRTSLST
jgi:hypothetical protein